MKYTVSLLFMSTILCAGLTGCSTNKDNDNTNDSSGSVAQKWVDIHNKYRSMHHVPKVTWSDEIAKKAQAYADKCPDNHSGSGYGENMAWGPYGDNVEKAVNAWYKEEPKHDYNTNSWRNGVTGHFTQVVWKNTTEIGCGYKVGCAYGGLYVCQYNPSGNYNNDYKNNVFPK